MKKNEQAINGGELKELPNDKYVKFFAQFKEIDTLKVEQWKVVHLIGYFCHQFETIFGSKYQFKFNSTAPSKCFEVFQIKKLGQLLSTQPNTLTTYIDWVFAEKAVKGKIRFRSISFLTREDILQEYKKKVLSLIIDRTTSLPQHLIELFNAHNNNQIQTYGDLAFHYMAHKHEQQWRELMFEATEQYNFDISILEKIV